MMDYKDYGYSTKELLNSIKLEFDNQEYVILVEGKEDLVFYSQYFNFEEEVFFYYPPAPNKYSKGIVIELAKIYQSIAKFCAIVDADLDRITKEMPKEHNIFLTDYHDLEMGIFMSSAIDKILRTINNYKKNIVECFIEKNGCKNLRELIFKKALILAYLRYLNHIHKWKLSFKFLHGSNLFDTENFCHKDMCIHYLISHHNTKNPSNQLNTNLIMKTLEEALKKKDEFNFPQFCHGKDTCKIALYYFNHDLKDKRKDEINMFTLKTAFTEADFMKFQIYKDITTWFEKN